MKKRFFLNEEHDSIASMVATTDSMQGKKYFSADITLHDCSRQVTIEFGCDKATRQSRLRKIRKMIATLQEVERNIAGYKFGKLRDFDL